MTLTIGQPGQLIPDCVNSAPLQFNDREVVSFPGLSPQLTEQQVPQASGFAIQLKPTASAKPGVTITANLHDVPDPNFPNNTFDYTIHVTFAGSAPPTTHFAVTAPASATAGTAFNFTVTAQDASNNSVTGYTGTVHFTSMDAQAVLPADSTLTNGTGTLSATLKTVGNQTIKATDTVSATITGTSSAITVTASTGATHFAVTAPASATAGTVFNFTVTAKDASSNTATGYTGTVHFTSTDAQAVLPADSTLTNGTGTFSATLNTAGNQTITATDTMSAAIAGSSSTITVTAISATHFVVSAPASSTAGTAFNFTVTAEDASNSKVTDYAGTVHFASSDAQAVLPADSTLTNGTATFSATLKTVGNQTITATDTVNATITGQSGPIAVGSKTYSQNAILTPGNIVAIDDAGDTIVTAEGFEGSAAFVFVFDGGVWKQATQLNNPDIDTGGDGAASAAIGGDGKTIVIGSCGKSTCKGHAFVYLEPQADPVQCPNNGWLCEAAATNPTATLSASDANPNGGDRIGFSVGVASGKAVNGAPVNVVAVSAPNDITQGCCGGHVYVFVEPGGGWMSINETAEITSPLGNGSSVNFGTSVSIDSAGDTIAVGATNFLVATGGEAFVFSEPSGGWANTSVGDAALTPSDGVGGNLGRSVAISGDGNTIVAGAPVNPASGNNEGPGAAYVFQKPGSSWASEQENAKLTAIDGQNGSFFGGSVAIVSDGSTVVVGADDHQIPNAPGFGAVYIYPRPGATWSNPAPQSQELSASGGQDINGNSVTPTNFFGISVAISADASTLAVGGNVKGAPAPEGVFVF